MSADGPVTAPDLREADFARHPVWRFRLDGESDDEPGIDESHLQPHLEGLVRGAHASYLVAARYTLADGRELPGAVQVDLLDRDVHCTPALLFAGGKALDPLARDLAARLARITGRPASRPRRWVLSACFAGEQKPRRGRIAASVVLQALGLLARLLWLRLRPRR